MQDDIITLSSEDEKEKKFDVIRQAAKKKSKVKVLRKDEKYLNKNCY